MTYGFLIQLVFCKIWRYVWYVFSAVHIILLGTLSNDDDDNNVKEQLVLRAKQLLCTCITLFSTFLWLLLHDYDVKPPNAMIYGGGGHTTTNLALQLQEKSPTFQIDVIKFERTQIHFFSDVFTRRCLRSLMHCIRFWNLFKTWRVLEATYLKLHGKEKSRNKNLRSHHR